MKILVIGASGATGKLLVEQLLKMKHQVKVIVRSTQNIPDDWKNNNNISIIQDSISDISEDKMAQHVKDCDAIASCLGHNLSFKGMFGKPRKLVRDAVRLSCKAIKRNQRKETVKFVLMNTSGNWNRDLKEPITIGERIVISLLRLLLPPHPDNEKAADYLRVEIGQNDPLIEWVAVRPDGLIDEAEVTKYSEHQSPITSPIFKPGKTSRINVGNFMARLITDSELWSKWKGQMPVIYNEEQGE